MGKKDARNNTSGLPVDQYRKQIGKNQYKRTSRDAKAMKGRGEARESAMSIQEIVLVLGAVFVVFAGLYFLFFIYVTSDSKSKQADNT